MARLRVERGQGPDHGGAVLVVRRDGKVTVDRNVSRSVKSHRYPTDDDVPHFLRVKGHDEAHEIGRQSRVLEVKARHAWVRPNLSVSR